MRFKNYLQPENVNATEDNITALQILDAAYDLFVERGYRAVTLRDVASRANVNLGLIPYYFQSKENLAKRVCQDIFEELFQKVQKMDLSGLTNAEKLYVIGVLQWRLVKQNEGFNRFYNELIDSTGATNSPSDSFVATTWHIIRDYGLEVTKVENEIYFTALKGAERMLVFRYNRGELGLTLEDIIDLLISNYFYNIGLPDQEIAKIISSGRRFCENFQ